MSGSRGYATKMDDFISVGKHAPQLAFEAAINEASTRLGKNLHPKFEMRNDFYREFGFFVFWDFENTVRELLDGYYDLTALKRKITQALKHVNKKHFVIGLIGYGNLNLFSWKKYYSLQDPSLYFSLFHVEPRIDLCDTCKQGAQVELEDVPHQRKSDLADKLLILSMLLYAMDVKKPANVLVISGDADFATPIASLQARGFTMFVAVDKDANTLLKNSGNRWWWWSQLHQGGGPI